MAPEADVEADADADADAVASADASASLAMVVPPSALALPSALPPSSVARPAHATNDSPITAHSIGGTATTRCGAPQKGHALGSSIRWRVQR